MNETYMLAADPAADRGMALYKLDDEAAKECHPIQSTDIDREFAPLQLYACDRALAAAPASETVSLASGESQPAVYTLMLVSCPFPKKAVILTSSQFDREEYVGGPGAFIGSFMEILRGKPLEALTAHARRLLREKSEPKALRKENGSSMTYEDMMDLLI